MKKFSLVVMMVMAFSFFSYGANAAIVDYGSGPIDVGGVDPFISEGVKLGNTDAEAAWVQDVLGDTSIDWTVKVSNVRYIETDVAGVYAFNVLLSPDYFIVKNATRVALFGNVDDVGWGVFDSSDLSAAMNIPSSDWQVSHVTSLSSSEGGGGINSVPEAPLSLLIGTALFGLGYIKKIT